MKTISYIAICFMLAVMMPTYVNAEGISDQLFIKNQGNFLQSKGMPTQKQAPYIAEIFSEKHIQLAEFCIPENDVCWVPDEGSKGKCCPGLQCVKLSTYGAQCQK